jgi:ADP-dependent NAD(P)H-hydrate dehydratase
VGGGVGSPGAALLAGMAALRVGAGKVAIATCARNATPLGIELPEAFVIAMPETAQGGIDPAGVKLLSDRLGSCDTVLIGPGLADKEATGALTRELLERVDGPHLVLDAEAIVQMRQHRELLLRHPGRIVITPHAGEMAGLLGRPRDEIEADPLSVARRAAADLQVFVILKGRATVMADPDGATWRSTAGNVGLATSGSGDVLAGFIAGLLARGAAPATAAAWGVFLHAAAGDELARRLGPLGYLAGELAGEAPRLLATLSGER